MAWEKPIASALSLVLDSGAQVWVRGPTPHFSPSSLQSVLAMWPWPKPHEWPSVPLYKWEPLRHGHMPKEQSPCPGSRPVGDPSPALPHRVGLGATRSKEEATQRPTALVEGSPVLLSMCGRAGRAWLAQGCCHCRAGAHCRGAMLPQRPYFLSHSRQEPQGKGSEPLGRWSPRARGQPPSDGGEDGLGFGGSVCSISHVQTKAKLHVRGHRSITSLTVPPPRVSHHPIR